MTKYSVTYKKRTRRHISSSLLYSKSSLIIGMGSIFNLAGNYFDFNYDKSESAADNRAIFRDWTIIGSDLEKAMKSI